MSIVFMEGFDYYNGVGPNTGMTSRWTASSRSGLVAGRFGGQAIQHNTDTATSGFSICLLESSVTSFACGFALKLPFFGTAGANNGGVFGFYNSTNAQFAFTIRPNAFAGIDIYRQTGINSAATIVGSTANNILRLSTWHYIECVCDISTTSGSIKLWVDGAQVLNLSNVNNQAGISDVVDSIVCGWFGSVGGGGSNQIDDIYVTDTSVRIGERKIETLYPNSDIAQGFIRSSGTSNFSLVDDPQTNTTDYVIGTAPGDTDTYGFTNLTTVPTFVDAVQVNTVAMKTDAATRNISIQLISGPTVDDGPDFALSGSYNRYGRLVIQDPNTGSTWTASAVNNIQGGPKVAS